ncbi:(R)-1-hydroxy-2-aminoethylphosphonate ammonia-lyase [Desulfamplus magnetovallimortis]|uniref:(R)-1-hydroxy-2-aminoethylphosphonate ammonia-lyase n=1 Tax=Desulfamplus magnetovallimortis TaxID=1246637 RepID=UPI001C989826|nr:aspartate aminotransferase family protein [Desulfamplus magnetovallimortis]
MNEKTPQKADRTEGDINLSSARQKWSEKFIGDETRHWLERDAEAFLHQSLSSPCLDVLMSCEGSTITDLEGRTFLDFHGNSVHQVGFGNPKVLEAVRSQLGTLPFSPRRYTNVPAIKLAEKLGSLAPVGSSSFSGKVSGQNNVAGKVLFAPGGTLAVGMALKLARIVTGRFKTISMWDAFHGASLDAISLGGEALFRRGIGPLLPGTEHVPPADPSSCLWDSNGDCEACGLKCATYIDYVLEKEGDVAALIAEPVRCTNINLPPKGYWQAVRKACDKHGALLIFDETAVCLGRTGKMFACENYDVEPDILTLGKGLGGGVLPMAAIVARRDLDLAPDKALGHYTHEKSPVGCAAGLATIEFIESEGLLEKTVESGTYAVNQLVSMKTHHLLIRDVRGIGLLFGMEIGCTDLKSTVDVADVADAILYGALSKGLSFKISQGNFLTLTPPLTITKDELDHAMNILDSVITEVEQKFLGIHNEL